MNMDGFARTMKKLVSTYQNFLTDVFQFLLDLFAIFFGHLLLALGTFGLLLDAGDHSPRGSTCTDHVLVGDREQIAFFVAQFTIGFGDLLHGVGHVVVSTNRCEMMLGLRLRHRFVYRSACSANLARCTSSSLFDMIK